MNHKLFYILFLFALLSCGENKVVDQAAIDKQKIEDYLEAKQLDALTSASGLYYIISEAGTGDKPGAGATVTVTYKGYLLDDRVFDQGDFYTGSLPSLIKGWQEGTPADCARRQDQTDHPFGSRLWQPRCGKHTAQLGAGV